MRTPTSFTRRALATGLAVAAMAIGLVACGSDSGTASPGTSSHSTGTKVTVSGQWARATVTGATTGAVYLTVQSDAGDVLTGVKVDASVAASAEMHQTMVMGASTSMGSGTTVPAGGMTMGPVDSIPLTAGTPFVFEPGGYHIMLNQLAKPLAKGDSFVLTLSLQKAGDVQVTVPVLDEAP